MYPIANFLIILLQYLVLSTLQQCIQYALRTDMQRLIDTLITYILILKNPQFLPNIYDALSK